MVVMLRRCIFVIFLCEDLRCHVIPQLSVVYKTIRLAVRQTQTLFLIFQFQNAPKKVFKKEQEM